MSINKKETMVILTAWEKISPTNILAVQFSLLAMLRAIKKPMNRPTEVE